MLKTVITRIISFKFLINILHTNSEKRTFDLIKELTSFFEEKLSFILAVQQETNRNFIKIQQRQLDD